MRGFTPVGGDRFDFFDWGSAAGHSDHVLHGGGWGYVGAGSDSLAVCLLTSTRITSSPAPGVHAAGENLVLT